MTDEMSYLAGAYALDALDEGERAEFERHLDTCPDCTDEVAGFRNVASELTHLEFVEPPAVLRENLLGQVSRTRPLPPVAPVIPITSRRRRVPWVLSGIAAACAVIAVVAATWGFQQHQGNSTTSALATVLAAADGRTVTGAVNTTGRGSVVYSKSRDEAYLVVHDLPAAGAGKTYEAWYIAGTKITPAGLFSPDASGTVIFKASGNLGPVTTFGVSVEPAGGSQQPTSTPSLLALS